MRMTGYYTTYQGQDFELITLEFGQYSLKSNDVNDVERYGFVELRAGTYIKAIAPQEVGEVYRLKNFLRYHGKDFEIDGSDERGYLIHAYADKSAFAQSHGFEVVDERSREYRKWVKREELDRMWEVRTVMPAFFGQL